MSQSSDDGARRFATTHWTVVLQAREGGTAEAGEALAQLCRTYWYPLYAFIRRQGYQRADAEDLIQEFFVQLMDRKQLEAVDRAKGRFRSFVLAVLKHFLAKERERAGAMKRGGGKRLWSLDFDRGEARFGREPAHDCTAERLYERQWALALLDQVLLRLGADYARGGKQTLFDRLHVFLTASAGAPSYAEIAGDLEMTEGAIKVAVHRLRRRYRELLREEVAQTVDGDADIQQELDYLVEAVARP